MVDCKALENVLDFDVKKNNSESYVGAKTIKLLSFSLVSFRLLIIETSNDD